MKRINTYPLLSFHINVTTPKDAIQEIEDAIANDTKGTVNLCGAHGTVETILNPEFKLAYQHAFLNLPDGMPLVWISWIKNKFTTRRVFGPSLMYNLLKKNHEEKSHITHFFYGGTKDTLNTLLISVKDKFPNAKVIGQYCPPFRPLTFDEEVEFIRKIRELKPDIIWVGIGAPKQEVFMHQMLSKLDCKIMIGVGAAFDILIGKTADAPSFLKILGLQWLHRLCQEPKRLWRRYLIVVPCFIILCLYDILILTPIRFLKKLV